MKLHILGICGTFMGGIAQLAAELGHQVQGCDANVYPPMSTQLEQAGIELIQGFDPSQLEYRPDIIIIGNALSRGNELVEYILNNNLPYTSGPQWLAENILQHKWVLAVSGTHGKTTTSSMLAWILQANNKNPSFLIGGVPENFGHSAQLTDSDYFVIEADEYDTAFFDKRSKFVHYHPKTLVINNLEYDHADIFENLQAIQKQFHHLVRIVPENGLIIVPEDDLNIAEVLAMGHWTPIEYLQRDWQSELIKVDGSAFKISYQNKLCGELHWCLLGQHNVHNALAAIAAAHHIGIEPADAINALNDFQNVKRRMEIVGTVNEITLYDDFAHHPTAIKTTLEGLRNKVGSARIIAIAELGSNTMRNGTHEGKLIPAFEKADEIVLYLPNDASWQLKSDQSNLKIISNVDLIVKAIVESVKSGDHIVIMSNRGFGGIHQKLLQALQK